MRIQRRLLIGALALGAVAVSALALNANWKRILETTVLGKERRLLGVWETIDANASAQNGDGSVRARRRSADSKHFNRWTWGDPPARNGIVISSEVDGLFSLRLKMQGYNDTEERLPGPTTNLLIEGDNGQWREESGRITDFTYRFESNGNLVFTIIRDHHESMERAYRRIESLEGLRR